MAGVPPRVVGRADALLDEGAADDDGGDDGNGDADDGPARPTTPTTSTAATDGGELPEKLRAELRAVDLADTTPLEALNLLARLKGRAE